MPATEEISERLVRENIIRALAEVFQTMLDRSVEFRGTSDTWEEAWGTAGVEDGGTHIAGTVGFTGDVAGLIYLYLDVESAQIMTTLMLGPDGHGDEAVNDAIGELTNMIVGVFKSGLTLSGYECRLTIPSILRGRNFRVEPIGSARRHFYRFESQGRRVVADILLRHEA